MHSENQGLITNLEEWKTEYRKDKTKVWIVVTLSDSSLFFFNSFDDWYKIIELGKEKGLRATEVGLRYRSNVYRQELRGEGLYLSKSALGSPGVDTIDTMTIGSIEDDTVFKTTVQLPALQIMGSFEDGIEDCFEEATWLWRKQKIS